jgi:hypothetical protein
MKRIPVLFTPAMVRAILDGRKTQTRRLKSNAEAGDVLWVRETWTANPNRKGEYLYKASNPIPGGWKWKPSLFMPKEACRLFLRVTETRLERLQDASDADILAEGIKLTSEFGSIRNEWITLWNSINAKPGSRWEDNPMVKAITFEPTENCQGAIS